MKKIVDFVVKENKLLTDNMFLLTLQSNELPTILPGQFVNVKIEDSPTTFLRRPISVYDVDETNGLLYLLIKIAGAGTLRLSKLKQGEKLNIILPLGNSFFIPSNGHCLLIGGGVGIAPMFHLAKKMTSLGLNPTLLIGTRSKKEIVQQEILSQYAELYYTTEDGSYGEKGYPTQHSILQQKFDYVYSCGPEVMMKAIANYAYKNDISCEVSLENMMACGIGACLCCVTETQQGHKCVCTEGPVFNIKDLKWQN
ncbi:dihydroorotate dehydrogenase electron transfer subunit [Odoribacter lunatus]|uniref:dihydroorotate dehydrogenase electron transfer subunit n=1 Tax=Odoribacter lunatus TaxID=2941335 RepID=UPI00203EB133|nr:dihydroorotate dehydrogenase electron transfer subunit [Odoribacter lunatus]